MCFALVACLVRQIHTVCSLLLTGPGEHGPILAYDKNGLKVQLHVSKAAVPPAVAVFVVSFVNTCSLPLHKVVFQAAVPKVRDPHTPTKPDPTQTLQVRLQPPSGSDLPPAAPGAAPVALTQIMLVANPTKVEPRRFFVIQFGQLF